MNDRKYRASQGLAGDGEWSRKRPTFGLATINTFAAPKQEEDTRRGYHMGSSREETGRWIVISVAHVVTSRRIKHQRGKNNPRATKP